MGLLATVKGADFSANAIGFAAPVTTNLEFWNYFGGTQAKSARNLVVGKPGVSQYGTPVPNAGYASLVAGSNYYKTGLLDQLEVTMLAVARFSFGSVTGAAAVAPLIGSELDSATNNGSNLVAYETSGAVVMDVQAARTTSGTTSRVTTSVAVAAPTAFKFYTGRVGAAYQRIDVNTDGTSTVGAVTGTRSVANGAAYAIGNFEVAAAGGAMDLAFAAIYSRCLTDVEVASIYAKVQSYLASAYSIAV